MLADLYGFAFASSSEFACERLVFPVLGPKYGYRDVLECFNDRRSKRLEWKALISAYNTPDKARLAREILAENDVYVGMRCDEEYDAAYHLFDRVYWVDAMERVGTEDESLKITYCPRTMTLIDNNGSLRDLENELVRIFG